MRKTKVNVIVHGLGEPKGATVNDRENEDKEATEELLHVISCDTVSVRQVTRLGAPPSADLAAKPRPLRITFESEHSRDYVLKNAKKLERQGGSLEESFPPPRLDSKAEGGQEKVGSGNAREEEQWRNKSHHSEWEDNDEKNIGHTGDEDCSANEEASTDHQGTTAKSLKCFYTNAGSVIQKMAELKHQIKVQNADIVAVVETWAHAGIGDAELALEGFVAYRVDRREQRGGGRVPTSMDDSSGIR